MFGVLQGESVKVGFQTLEQEGPLRTFFVYTKLRSGPGSFVILGSLSWMGFVEISRGKECPRAMNLSVLRT